MKTPAPADVQRWSDEVARDPASLAFLPLARAYRRQGLHDAALQLCLRGLERYPSHVEAHSLLALLYLEKNDHVKAADEWSIVLRIDADNFDALRGMGFCYLEQDQLSRARQMLERAALLRPGDTAVQEALRVLGTRQELSEHGLGRGASVTGAEDPWAEEEHIVRPPPSGPQAPPAGTSANFELVDSPDSSAPPGAAAPESARYDAGMPSFQPTRLFDDLLESGALHGALLIDPQGLVLAGRMRDGAAADAAVLGAVLGDAIGEAARTVQHLALGAWRGILLEMEGALVHVSPAGPQAVVVLAAHRTAPTGWLLRTAVQAAERAAAYAEEYA